MTPWQHYVAYGFRKGYGTGNHPSETAFFREGYELEYPDVKASGLDAWHHYVEHGIAEGRDNGLHPDEKLFFARGYLEMYPDVAKAEVDPWKHYVLNGKQEGRDNGLHPGEKQFFAEGYLEMYPDVAKAKVDPWKHYVLNGKQEGRDNGLHPDEKFFFADGYCQMYPDLYDNPKADPWRHYVLHGKNEGRAKCGISSLKRYTDWVFDVISNKTLFVQNDGRSYARHESDPKIFAYYLPQYHSIPINDENYGKGFTEWTNVSRASPLFWGHYQPRIPYDYGFYDLDHVETLEKQAALAKQYGIYGFCFYYYWFGGKKVMEKPLKLFIDSKIDLHFHLMWANENWSKLWDGGNKEVILEQRLNDLSLADVFYKDIRPYIKDKRYEKLNNKPILAIYRPSMFKEALFCAFLERLHELARQDGFDGFYFLGTNFSFFHEPEKYGLQGLVEFPPHGLSLHRTSSDLELFNTRTNIKFWDVHRWIGEKNYLEDKPFKVFKCCFPHWDNSPRKAYSGGAIFPMEEGDFYKWLSGIIEWTRQRHAKNEQYVYINAWNEWGEGAYLEPDLRYGYKYLNCVRKVLEDARLN